MIERTAKKTVLDVERVVRERYSAAARDKEACLCTAVGYDPRLLDSLPAEIVERDYGCGDPTRWIKRGENVLDLGCGAGKVCYIAAQIVGPIGRVIGIDRNDEMLAVARRHQHAIADRLGFANTCFFKGSIQDLALDLDRWDDYLRENHVESANDWLRAEAEAERMRRERPMAPDGSIDVVVSNCVLNLVGESDRRRLFDELFRVLKRGGRAVISDIVADRTVPRRLKEDPKLWSGCVSGAFVEGEFVAAFARAGFEPVGIIERQAAPWRVVEGVEFRSVTVRAEKPLEGNPAATIELGLVPQATCCGPG
jgi:ubiquinone/menaquinone biosynthesis C-methylase UbiE